MVTTTYPNTPKPTRRPARCGTPRHFARGTREPLAAARGSLHAAARLPFASSQGAVWRSRFAHHVETARNAVREHVISSNRADSVLSAIEREEPRLRTVVEKQRCEHAELVRQTKSLSEEAASRPDVDIWRMIDLGEKAMLLEMALARHQDRLVQLVYEATNRELGGEAG